MNKDERLKKVKDILPRVKEIEELIQRAKKFLDGAELLLNNGDYESSVLWSYYAIFYCVSALFLTKNLKFSSYRGIVSSFGRYFVKTDIFTLEMGKN